MTIYYDDGAYNAEIIDQGLSMSSKNNPQLWLKIRVFDKVDSNEHLDQLDRMIYWTITDKTVNFIVDKLERLGFVGESFRLLDPTVEGYYSLIGQRIEAYCKVETYENKDREKWDLSMPLATNEPLDETEARKLDALFGRKLKERFGASGVRKSAAKAAKNVDAGNDVLNEFAEQTAAAANDDDIAF